VRAWTAPPGPQCTTRFSSLSSSCPWGGTLQIGQLIPRLASASSLQGTHTIHRYLVVADHARAYARLSVLAGATWPRALLQPCMDSVFRSHPSKASWGFRACGGSGALRGTVSLRLQSAFTILYFVVSLFISPQCTWEIPPSSSSLLRKLCIGIYVQHDCMTPRPREEKQTRGLQVFLGFGLRLCYELRGITRVYCQSPPHQLKSKGCQHP